MQNKKFKKHISLLLALLIAIIPLGTGLISFGANDGVDIDDLNFPDENFQKVVKDWYDLDGNKTLTKDEVEGVTLISISGMLMDTCDENAVIEDLKGIEYFTDCKRLRCGGIGLKSLDVSRMPQLVELTCAGNSLTELNVIPNSNLEWLNCSSNDLTSLDVTKNSKLTRLDCYINQLSELDVTKNPMLGTLRCQRNNLSALDLTKNTELTILNCSSNHLLNLDLSNNTKLVEPTDAFIGNQTTKGVARVDNGNFFVALNIPNYQNISATSVDRYEIINDYSVFVLGYDGFDFCPTSYDQIENGIDFYYNTGLAKAESMSVHVDVERNFYQVRFYTDEDKQTLIKSELVNVGEGATAPEITEENTPQCKTFNSWSESFDNIQGDVEAYALWDDNHTMAVTAFNGEIVRVSCTECGNEVKDYEFVRLINVRAGEKRYVEAVDINSDGIINAKDFAKLLKMFK